MSAPFDLHPYADNGGPGTHSQLLILKECMSRLANDLGVSEDEVYPVDYFDLMGGVGFGGYVYYSICRVHLLPIFQTRCSYARAFSNEHQPGHRLTS